ncbi:MAG: UPF0104 family protein [Hyphomicrobiales bacterium]|nr:UPF0104 family protein [Hyphomicrobiales bacterium]
MLCSRRFAGAKPLGRKRFLDDVSAAQELSKDSPSASGGENDRLFSAKHPVKTLGAIFSLAIFLLSLFILARVVAKLDIGSVRAAIAATSAEQIVAAGALTALSYFALTGYDALALRQLRAHVPYRITALGSFTSYAISFTLGFPLITAGTVRYWIYSRAGLTAGRVASLTIVAGVTFWIGMAAVIGFALIARAEPLSWLDLLAPWMNRAIGAAILCAILAYLVWTALKPRRVTLQGFNLQLPGPLVTGGQVALGVIDLCSAAGALYVLLPKGAAPDFLTFAATYVFGAILGIVSHAPGGIGVFEATIIKFTPGGAEAAILASLLLFRMIYYLAPFVLALALLGANEAMRRWKSLRADMERDAGGLGD